jgi:hypothetical protein
MSIQVSGEAPNRIITIEKEPDNWLMEAIEYVLSTGGKKYPHWADGLHAQENVIWGTDGSRLHAVRDVPIPDGSYATVSKNKKAIVLKEIVLDSLPNYKSITDRTGRKDVNLPDASCRRTSAGLSSAFAVVVRNLEEKLTVNIDYLGDALSGDCDFTAYFGKDKDSIIFAGESGRVNRLAVVMPQGI